MDIEMPQMNGIEATEFVKNRYPQIKILILTVFDNDDNIFNAIKAGADGYLLKEISPHKLQKSIIEVIAGGAAMSPSIAFKTLKLLRNPQEFANKKCEEEIKLSTREIEVLEQLSRGLSYNIIAINLFLSPSTIRNTLKISTQNSRFIINWKRLKKLKQADLFKNVQINFTFYIIFIPQWFCTIKKTD
jgi:DNA-binding NarL/FixJ family response regulator